MMRGTMVFSALAVSLLVSGCDQGSKSDAVTIHDKDGSVTISAKGQNFTMKAVDSHSGSFVMTGDAHHFTMHAADGKETVDINTTGGPNSIRAPAYIALYPGAKVRSASLDATGKGAGGTFIFETRDSPDAVIAYYKRKTADAGLKKAIDMSMGTTSMFSATADGGKKSIQVVAANSGGGARVQVNWSGGK